MDGQSVLPRAEKGKRDTVGIPDWEGWSGQLTVARHVRRQEGGRFPKYVPDCSFPKLPCEDGEMGQSSVSEGLALDAQPERIT